MLPKTARGATDWQKSQFGTHFCLRLLKDKGYEETTMPPLKAGGFAQVNENYSTRDSTFLWNDRVHPCNDNIKIFFGTLTCDFCPKRNFMFSFACKSCDLFQHFAALGEILDYFRLPVTKHAIASIFSCMRLSRLWLQPICFWHSKTRIQPRLKETEQHDTHVITQLNLRETELKLSKNPPLNAVPAHNAAKRGFAMTLAAIHINCQKCNKRCGRYATTVCT